MEIVRISIVANLIAEMYFSRNFMILNRTMKRTDEYLRDGFPRFV